MTHDEFMNALPDIFASGLTTGIIEGLKVCWPIFALCAVALIAKILLKKK